MRTRASDPLPGLSRNNLCERQSEARIAWSALNLSGSLRRQTNLLARLNSVRWRRELLRRIGLLYRRLVPEPAPREIIGSIGEPFVSVLCSMYDRQPQCGAEDKMYPIDATTRIGPKQGMLIYQLVRDTKPDNTLEIGLAFGFSTVYFLAAIQANGKGHHVALDPHQTSRWHDIGLARGKVLGIEAGIFEFSSENSIQGLARLAREQRQFEIIFIDGNHRFDSALSDFFLASFVCKPGGHIILDDMWMLSIQRVASFIRLNRPDFTEVRTSIQDIAVFRMTNTDERPWDHFVPF